MSGSSSRLIFYAGGIFILYFYYGILQEKITRGSYGENKEKFTYMIALVFAQCLVNYAFAKLLLLTVMKENDDSTRTSYYAAASLTYFLAMVSTNEALKFVNYPTQVVGKAGKPIPVMLLGVLVGKKTYPIKKYFFVTMIVLGAILFMYKDGKASTKNTENPYGFGEMLLLLSLTMDGLTSAVQERMRAEHKTTSGYMMLNMNFWTIIISGALIVLTGELLQFILFMQKYPTILWHILAFSIASALGQFFIFRTITEFGPLPCSIITTTRKFFTVLGSVLLFGNSLLPRQWIATTIVFSGLFLDALYGRTKNVKKEIEK